MALLAVPIIGSIAVLILYQTSMSILAYGLVQISSVCEDIRDEQK